MFRTLNTPQVWIITLAAAGIMMVTMGSRQSLGLFEMTLLKISRRQSVKAVEDQEVRGRSQLAILGGCWAERSF